MHALWTSCHLLQLVQKSALSEVSVGRSRTLAGKASSGTSSNPLRARGLHASSSLGSVGSTKPECDLQSVVSHQCGDTSGSRARSPASRCGDRFLQRATYLESKNRTEPSLRMPFIIISFVFNE